MRVIRTEPFHHLVCPLGPLICRFGNGRRVIGPSLPSAEISVINPSDIGRVSIMLCSPHEAHAPFVT
jgi:hypothetical protein